MRLVLWVLPSRIGLVAGLLLVWASVLTADSKMSSAAGLAQPGMTGISGQHGSLVHRIYIRGKDDRVPVSKHQKLFARSIGIFTFDGGGGCTAFCVGRDLAMTAGHCFLDPKTRKLRKNLSLAKFRLLNMPYARARRYAWVKGNTPAEAIANITMDRRISSSAVGRFKTDWAIARLSHPICLGWLPLKQLSTAKLSSASRRGQITMIGYHGDRIREGILQSPKCRLRNRKIPSDLRRGLRRKTSLGAATMIHSCDAAKGSSGSPIFITAGQDFAVVAINVGFIHWKKWRKKRGGRKRIIGRWKENIAVLTGPLRKLVKKLQQDELLTSEEEFLRLQDQLNRAGFNVGSVDGKIGRRTRRAIRKFEKKQGEATTGLATRSLLIALEALNTR